MDEMLVERIQPSFQSYLGIDNDVAYTSDIQNLNINSATSFSMTYNKPNDGKPVRCVIWSGLIADVSVTPIFSQTLNAYAGTVQISTPAINLLKGAYTIAIASDDIRVVGATQSILNGQNLHAGSSSLYVIGKNLTTVNTVYSMPANILASQTITWVMLFEGSQLGKGTRLATQTTTPSQASGYVQLVFPAGTLKEGQMYNVVLNPGQNTQYITAGYTFKYALM